MDLKSIVEKYRPKFEKKYAKRITREQRAAMEAMLDCRTERYGKMLLGCQSCELEQWRYHSCGHRFCPCCQQYDTACWLQRQSEKLLPVDYFLVTFTLPYELRPLAWHHQKTLYALLFDCATSTLKTFAGNSIKLSGDPGMTAVLHTHSRRLDYHPHAHIIVPGGAINKKRRQWKKLKGKYLFNEFSLAKVFRARFLQRLCEAGFALPNSLPKKWVVDCKHVGQGLPALKYLSRYLYRGVISEKNILQDDGVEVMFRYRDSESNTWQQQKLRGEDFLWQLLQHVLPKGFRRIRDYGFLHGNAKKTLRLIQQVLKVMTGPSKPVERSIFTCTGCGHAMHIIRFVPPAWRAG
jgi:hypothetical protein